MCARPVWLLVVLTSLLFRVFSGGHAAYAQAEPTPSVSPTPPAHVHFEVTPYMWVPTINASLQFNQRDVRPRIAPPNLQVPTGANVQIGPNSYLSNLNSAFMVAGSVRRGNGDLFFDLIYLNLTSRVTRVRALSGPGGIIVIDPVNLSANARFRSTLWTLGVGGNLLTPATPTTLEAFAALRDFNTSASADWTLTGPLNVLEPSGAAQKSENLLVPVGGFKGRIALGPHFVIPYYIDGGGSSEVTSWQGIVGIGYAYHSGGASLVWRELGYFAQNNPSELLQNLHLGGPAFGWTFYLR